jgi:hypothetical protein
MNLQHDKTTLQEVILRINFTLIQILINNIFIHPIFSDKHLSGAPSGRSRRLTKIMRPASFRNKGTEACRSNYPEKQRITRLPADYTAFLPPLKPGDSKPRN